MPSPLPYSNDVELVQSDEAEDIRQSVEVLREILRRTVETTGEHRRDVHVKSNGCARGEFRVLPVGEHLAQGLFGRPETYAAIVRFSNSAAASQSDAVPDGRGLAVQIHAMPGGLMPASDLRVQNFVMVNHPTFIVSNVKDYLEIEKSALKSNSFDRALQLLTSGRLNPITWRWHALSAFAGITVQPPSHPASYAYYSMVPFRFGEWVCKYRVVPETRDRTWPLQTAAASLGKADAMRLALAESLRDQELAMNFEIQLRTSKSSMPIEDAAVEWPQQESPFLPVAQLVLPRQDIELPTTEIINSVSFNVWHGLTDHQPLGGINRLRRHVYEVSASWRQSVAYDWDLSRAESD